MGLAHLKGVNKGASIQYCDENIAPLHFFQLLCTEKRSYLILHKLELFVVLSNSYSYVYPIIEIGRLN